MLVKSIAAFAALTFAASVAAEPAPYKPANMKMSTREMFGVVRRDDAPGYIPEQAACNLGATCEEACGAEFKTCASSDKQVHCFNPSAEICCPDKSGNSCENGYFCTADKKGETFCCPEGMGLEECAKSYKVDGGLKSQTAPAEPTTSTTSSKASSTALPTTTTHSTTSISVELNTTSIEIETSTAESSPTFVPSASFIPSNTTSISSVNLPSPSSTDGISTGAGSVVGPASALVFLAAGLAALL